MKEQNSESLQQTILHRLIARYLELKQAGESVVRDEILLWHPESADDLRSFFAHHDQVIALQGNGVGVVTAAFGPYGKRLAAVVVPVGQMRSEIRVW